MPDANPRSFTAGGMWNGIPMACHNATLFWLYEAEFSRQPSLNDYLDAFSTHPKNPTGIVREMLPFGQRLSRPLAGNSQLTPGAVIVFVHNNQPGHSCIATTGGQVGGYNQVNWFTGAGAVNSYTTHATSEFKWRSAQRPNDIEGNTAQKWCSLLMIPQNAARAVVRKAVQG
ncbi:MAG TPA: hypothetical protein VJ890_10175 [Vineibacter sp.]|nr:hypothetical protein [Vineibacter sp.]